MRNVSLEATPQPFHWNAGYTIDGTIYKYGPRYYDTTTGRWTQADPVASEPRYAYAANDPINRSDPSGYLSLDDLADLPVVGRYAAAAQDLFDDNGDVGAGLKGLAAYSAGNLLATSTCTAAVIGFTGGIGAPAALGCFAAGTAVGTWAESQVE